MFKTHAKTTYDDDDEGATKWEITGFSQGNIWEFFMDMWLNFFLCYLKY